MDRPPMRTIQTPEEVVETALRALGHRKQSVISGWTNWLAVEAERFVPRSVVTKIAGKAAALAPGRLSFPAGFAAEGLRPAGTDK